MDRMRGKGLRAGIALVAVIALAGAPAVVAAADTPVEEASCVGQFSSFFAQGGYGTHRSIVAMDFATNARPAGLNVYSHVATGSGTLAECFAEF